MKKYSASLFTVASLLLFALNCFALDDTHITEIMKTANTGEIDAGKLAKKRATKDSVKTFAEKMVKEHTDNRDKVKEISKDQDIKMVDSDESKMLKDDAKKKIKDLKKVKGGEFDKAYMGTQVAMHQQLLDDLDQKLIPQAKNPKLKSYLEETRTHVQNHLNDAKTIQTELQ
ncbi:DUF4142 domain-containing protein [Bdellovibrio sp. SKB1291214]|uniref:DUF4142 domain-containing protein n=1 Tax=Bdellovibrio sp. SKB1291214 TaxID=1732569 RepID=UPI00159632F2|nr:DUF4142 domain-containing protein [Bdellovibrio sp. SKB1291214]UYL07868.1 DUF4142 domain-containing protein [Bdellovibrio sp. SKB1291214]